MIDELLEAAASDSTTSDADVAQPRPLRRVSMRVCEVCRGEGTLRTEHGALWCLVCDGRGGTDPAMVTAARDYHRGYFQLVMFTKE